MGEEPIDFVVTWVDGSDPKHKKKLNRFKPNEVKETENHSDTRFASNREINYCVLSILKFASWVNKIYIVTDNQVPPIQKDVEKYFPGRMNDIIMVDHSDIFPEGMKAIPNFNSISIESCLWKIPNLSERFVYFNDDFILIRPLSKLDFFNGNRPVLRGRYAFNPFYKTMWRSILNVIYKTFRFNKSTRISFQVTQFKGARLTGSKIKFWMNSHTPYAMNKEVLKKFYLDNSEIFLKNINYRFREYEQFNSNALNNSLEIKEYGNTNLINESEIYIKNIRGEKKLNKKLRQIKESNKRFLCIQSLDQIDEKFQEPIYRLLDEIIAKVTRDE